MAESLLHHGFSGDPWGPCALCDHAASHRIHVIPEQRCTGYCVGVGSVETLVEDLACPIHGVEAQDAASSVFPDRQAWLDSLKGPTS